jgi:hypothetical protein
MLKISFVIRIKKKIDFLLIKIKGMALISTINHTQIISQYVNALIIL